MTTVFRSRWGAPCTLALMVALIGGLLGASPPNILRFNRDIRPILSNNCFQCHGFDEKARRAGLRLDLRDVATQTLESGKTAIVPGDPTRSELVRRITTDDADDRMPPESTHRVLTRREIELLTRWIGEGAEYESHWSFRAPERPSISDGVRSEDVIDFLIDARLREAGLEPSPAADRATLIRRVTYDLTGLPPTLDEVAAFTSDPSPQAYEVVVDRLLASPHFGEHWGRYWLDAVRYGDTHGLHFDNERSMWKYRDWVIQALNDNLPFDELTVWQIAGDLLPEPTLPQLVASGFNRLNVTTNEGGAIAEEYLVKYAIDRVEAVSTVWLGLTVGCATCHDHKFDPISQKEFYELYAFFNSTAEAALDGNLLAPAPFIHVPSPEEATELARLEEAIASREARLDAPLPALDSVQADWERETRRAAGTRWEILVPELALSRIGGASLETLPDHSVLARGRNPATDAYDVTFRTPRSGITAIRLEALTHDSLPHQGPGRAVNANFVLSEFEAEVETSDSREKSPLRFAEAYADFSQPRFHVRTTIDGKTGPDNGWAVEGYERREERVAVFVPREPFGDPEGIRLRVRLRFDSQHEQHAIGRFRIAITSDPSMRPIRTDPWNVIGPFPAPAGESAHATRFPPEESVDLSASYDGDRLQWRAPPAWVDGRVQTLEGTECATYLYRKIHAPGWRQATLSLGSDDGIQAWLNRKKILDRDVARPVAPDQEKVPVLLRPGENELLLKISNQKGDYGFFFQVLAEGELLEIERILQTAGRPRTTEDDERVRTFYRTRFSPELRQVRDEVDRLREEKRRFEERVPKTLITRELETPRDAHVLFRGEYDQKGEKVSRGTPSILPPFPADQRRDRLGLARWLIAHDHPLTARVTVNRLWQAVYGTGLVKTAEDFGTQTEWPSHPKLLDWLAREFVESGWDLKHMIRLIVTADTYRRSSRARPEHLATDPDNRFLAHGPRFRMDAEMIRDTALAVSGLLVRDAGGRGVKPYQPAGLWKAVAYPSSDTAVFRQDRGPSLYRRSVYTFIKRTSPPPAMSVLDAPSRETCTVRRERTNTPMAALVLMNDPQFVEAARHLAVRMLREGGDSDAERIRYGFRLVTARIPSAKETRALQELLESQIQEFETDPTSSEALLQVGDTPIDRGFDLTTQAGWTVIASVLLNLDETLTKG